ncbi:MAG TPA: Hsp20 family protein [Pyrinomonadaceae bacterium]|jgi:HSP20 family protein|nr:Hsp20 family protein [Pyrinomonadaceae bacterium]
MNKPENVSKEISPKQETAITKPEAATTENAFPMFVEAEKMFERFAELTKETAQKAYEFFLKRGGNFGREIEDWFKAEAEILRPVTVEITETDKQISVNAMVPGFKPEEIEISVDGNILILSGTTEAESKKEDENTFYSEWRSNRFFRQLILPAEVNAEKVKANLKDGVLHLKLPKAAPHEAKQIAVSAG